MQKATFPEHRPTTLIFTVVSAQPMLCPSGHTAHALWLELAVGRVSGGGIPLHLQGQGRTAQGEAGAAGTRPEGILLLAGMQEGYRKKVAGVPWSLPGSGGMAVVTPLWVVGVTSWLPSWSG